MQIERCGPVAVLTPDSAKDLRALRLEGEAALRDGAATLLLDLGAVLHVRGDDLEHLTDLAFVCEERRRGLALASVSTDLSRALDLLHLRGLFAYVYADRAVALASLERSEIAPPGEPPLEIGF